MKVFTKKTICIIVFHFLILISCFSFSQTQSYSLELKGIDNQTFFNKLSYKKSFGTKLERDKEIQNILFTLYDNAYLTADVENKIKDEKDSLKEIVFVKIGEQYQWAILKKGNADEGILSEIGYKEKLFSNKPLYFKEVRNLQEKILIYCENNGYPFASIKLDSIVISIATATAAASFSASLNLQKNNLIKIDSIVNYGSAKISQVYFYNCLGIKLNDLYNESLVRKIDMRIKEIPFVKEKNPFRVLFTDKKARIELFLEKKRASQFDGIAGILPDNKTGKILLTGDVHLKLNNSFNHGELLDFNWRRLQAGTQDLKTRFVFPFLIKTPFGIDAIFKLYKKDSTYLEVNPNIGIQYFLNGGNYFKAFVNKKQMTLLSTSGLKNLSVLPPYADITSTLYGIGMKSENLDYRINPRKGYSFGITTCAGNKIIRKNDKLNSEIYDKLNLNTVQYNAELEMEFFVPIKNRSTIKLGTHSEYLHTETMFQNELFRIGGLKTLRGFDEESIYASSYYIFSVEYRYLFDENSYLFLFSDGAYYENKSISFSGDRYDTPYGFGAGISFETKAGIFLLNYALGKQFHNPIDLKAGKVHFGIVNYF
ncbi:MAG: hypothetical protein V1781_03150 [Bacteroidota bacterium]